MSRRSGWTAVHVLLVVALLEVGIDRVAVPVLRPDKGAPPLWHQLLDYSGLFLFFFTGALAVGIIGVRCYEVLVHRTDRGVRARVAYGWLAIAALVAARPLILTASTTFGIVIELGYFGSLVGLLVANISRERDLGVQLGLPILLAPLILHAVGVLGGLGLWSADPFDGPARDFQNFGMTTLCVAALVTPYCFAPRPFARAVGNPIPLVVAMSVATFGALVAHTRYPWLVKGAVLAIGLDLHPGKADPQLALYLISLATLTWTVVSCALARSPARRQIGMGITFIALGGYAFMWPQHYLLPMLGAALIVDAGRRVREEELEVFPIVGEAPPVSDLAWTAYIALVAQGLRKHLGSVHSLTTRGEAGLVSSVLVGEVRGIPVRVRIERVDGSVIALDICLGTEIDEARLASVTVHAIPSRDLGPAPPGPPASPVLPASDDAFAAKFLVRGHATMFRTLFDQDARDRAESLLDGWLAYWHGEGLRFRVYPGRGAPVDHPMPLPDLAMNRVPGNADRFVAVVELLLEVAARAELETAAGPPAEPTELGA